MLLHIPHSATQIPLYEGFIADREVIEKEVIKLTDWYTDELFEISGQDRLVTPFSRIFCDVERFEDNRFEPMSKFGMGVLYEKTDSGKILRTVDQGLRKKIIDGYYEPHHDLLTKLVEKSLLQYGRSLIVDCHSFPHVPLNCSMYQGDLRPDFNIGTDSFHTPTEWVDILKTYFLDEGYSVEIDVPYNGSIVPMRYYQEEKRVRSIMLEVNRKLYMNEITTEKASEFQKIQETVHGFLKLLERLEQSA